MAIDKVLIAMLAISAMTMALLENVEGGREIDVKEAAAAKVYNSPTTDENYDGYKPKEEYECEGYKYKDRDCYEYGNCDKYHYNEDGSPEYKRGEDGSPEYKWGPYKKPVLELKEMAGKHGVHPNFP